MTSEIGWLAEDSAARNERVRAQLGEMMEDARKLGELQREVADFRDLLKQVLDWDQNRDFIMPYRLRDPMRKAINWTSY